MEVLSISGKPVQVEEEAADELMEAESTIYRLIQNIGMLSKKQLWEYFGGDVSQENVSRLVNNLRKDSQVFMLPKGDTPSDSALERYVTDPRLADPDYYKKNKTDTYANLAKFRKHMELLESRQLAFWLYLQFKKSGGAGWPVTVETSDFPFIILAFPMMGDVYEVFHIRCGKENDLASLQAKERYQNEPLQRIIMVDDEIQIKKIMLFKIKGIRFFAINKGDGCFDFKKVNT